MKKIHNIVKFGLCAAILSFSSCSEDFIEAEPVAQVTPGQLANLPADKLAVVAAGKIKGVYSSLFVNPSVSDSEPGTGYLGIGLAADLIGSDMAMLSRGAYSWYWWDYTHSTTAGGSRANDTWGTYYNMIYALNGVLEPILEVPSEAALAEVYAQACVLRAFCYFNLVNLYQNPYLDNPNAKGVPVYLKASESEPKGRGTVQEVYDAILNDLENARKAYDVEGVSVSGKTVITKQVFEGIYANVLLFTGDYKKAATLAESARQGFGLMSRDDYVSGFNELNNSEWMWGFDQTTESSNSYDSWIGHIDNRAIDDGYAPYDMQKMMDQNLFNHIDPSDIRYTVFHVDKRKDIDVPETYTFTAWNDKFYNAEGMEFDYLSDYVFLRSSEMYLVQAEALVRDNRDAEAKVVLKELIESRCDGTDPYGVDAMDHDQLLKEVNLQSRIELWGEGKSYFIKKRFKNQFTRDYPGSNHNPSAQINFEYNDSKVLFYIPDIEMNNNPNISQEDQN